MGAITPAPRLAALLVAATLLAPSPSPARADAGDDAFLGALQAKDIHYPSPAAAIAAAHEVCNELRRGVPPSQVASDVMGNSRLDGYHAGYFVGASMRAYCPQYIS